MSYFISDGSVSILNTDLEQLNDFRNASINSQGKNVVLRLLKILHH